MHMPQIWPMILVGLCGLVGCSPFQLANRTLHQELNQYPRLTDGKISCREYGRWAEEEWSLVAAEAGDLPVSLDYKSGFLQGFVDHVYAGGRVSPPTMPPRRYWRLPFRNEQGQAAIRQWYSGFEHVAQVAKQKGYRDRAIIPSSLLAGQTAEESQYNQGEYIEMEEQLPLEEPTPALPLDPATNSELPLPPKIDDDAGIEPTATATPRETALSPSQDENGTRTSQSQAEGTTAPAIVGSPQPLRTLSSNAASSTTDTPRTESATGTEPRVTSTALDAIDSTATGLTLEADAIGPPLPPWKTQSSLANQMSSSKVIPASAEVPAPANTASTAAGVDEFDPFAGTRFAAPLARQQPPGHDRSQRDSQRRGRGTACIQGLGSRRRDTPRQRPTQ